MEPVAPSATHFWRLKPANAFEIFWKFCAQNRIKNEMKKVRGEIALASRLFLSTKGWNVLRNSWNSGRIIPLGNPKKRVANDEVFDFDSLSPYCCLCVCVCDCVCTHNQTSALLLGRGSWWRCPCTIILPGRGLSCARLRLRFFCAALCWHTFCKHIYTHTDTHTQTHLYLVCLSFFLCS